MLRAYLFIPVFLAFAIAIAGCGGNVPAPTSFTKFDAPDGAFSVEYPTGWDAKGGAPNGSGYTWAKFNKGNAQIKVDTGLSGSLMSDIHKSAGAAFGGQAPDPAEIVLRVHEDEKLAFAERYNSYKEQDPVTVATAGMGPAACSVFLGDGEMGVRATTLNNDRRVLVVCTCSRSNWKTLKPAFEKAVASLKR